MLRASCEKTNRTFDATTLLTSAPADIPHAAELVGLMEALTINPTTDPVAARDALVAVAGEEAAERAVGVIATFNLMNRMLDATGTPVSAGYDELGVSMGFTVDEIHH